MKVETRFFPSHFVVREDDGASRRGVTARESLSYGPGGRDSEWVERVEGTA